MATRFDCEIRNTVNRLEVIEKINVRFGDPEAQAVMPLLSEIMVNSKRNSSDIASWPRMSVNSKTFSPKGVERPNIRVV